MSRESGNSPMKEQSSVMRPFKNKNQEYNCFVYTLTLPFILCIKAASTTSSPIVLCTKTQNKKNVLPLKILHCKSNKDPLFAI